jgi:type IV secretion system protein VirB4
MQVASGSTPFRLNLHFGDLGHTIVFGPTGSGKSTLLALIAAQFRRYENSQVFCFDKGLAMYPMTLAVGGDHYDVGDDASLAFCPLSELDTDGDRAWASEWIEMLIEMQGVKITPEHRNSISTQIALLSKQKRRSLTNFVQGVQRQDIKNALLHYTTDGPMGHLLDAEKDTLTLSNFMCFEIGQLMNMGERNLVPILYYIFRRIEKRLTGAPSIIILDEAWLMLGHEMFRDKIREWLKVLRKANCIVLLATQSISDAAKSGIMDVLKESCPTKICLANGAAADPETSNFYQKLGFNERQVEIVSNAIPKRAYSVVSPMGRRLFHMALGPLTLSFVGASGKEDLERIDQLHDEYGHEWPVAWLRERGVEHAQALLG